MTAAGFRSVPGFVVCGQVVPAWRRSEFRWTWFATWLHVFVVLLEPEPGASLPELAREAQRQAAASKGGLVRGLQTGTACVPVLVAPGAGPAERAWAAGSQPKVFGSLCYPVLMELTLGTAIYRSRSQVWGCTYQPELWRVAGLIADGLGAARVQGDGPPGTSKPVLARVLGVLAAVLLIVTAALAGTGHVGRALVALLLAAICTLQAVGFAAGRSRGSAVPRPARPVDGTMPPHT